MKKAKIILLALLVMAVPSIALAGTSYAGNFQSGDNVVTKKNEVINHTLFVAGNNVEINGTVKGDVFCAGRNITITAKVDGDVICAGMNIDISGTVMGDVRAAGQVVTLSAKVDHNASLAGSNLHIERDAVIRSDLQTAGDSTVINGSVARDVDAAGSSIAVSGMIGRDLQAATENLQLNSDAKINGNVTYYSHNQLGQSSDAAVKGKVVRHEPQTDRERQSTNPLPSILFSFIALLTLAFAMLAVFPRKLRVVSDLALTKPGMTLLIGLAACIGVPALILISFMTVIGVYVGVVLLLAWILVMLVSGVLASYYAGRLVLAKTAHHPFVAMLTGVIVVSALLIIPIVNIITLVAIALLGSGMIIRELFEKSTAPTYETLSHPRRKTTRKA